VKVVAWLALLLVLLALPLYIDAAWLKAGQYMMIGAVGAIGLTLLVGQTGLLSLAHAFFLLAGGTAYCVLAGPTGDTRVVGLGLDPGLSLVGAVMISALLGLAFAQVSGRLRGIYLGVASLSLVFLGLYLGQSLERLTGGTSTGRTPATFSLFGFPFSNAGPQIEILGVPIRQAERSWYLFLLLTIIAFVVATGAVKGRIGRSWRAVRDNEAAAAVLGVNVTRTKAGAFAVSSAYAGLAGAMTVLWFYILKPDESEYGTYGINVSIAFLAMVIIGGLGSVPGALVGALIVNGLPQVLALLLRPRAVLRHRRWRAHPDPDQLVRLWRRDHSRRAVRTGRPSGDRPPHHRPGKGWEFSPSQGGWCETAWRHSG
jgi:branched-chain amino acid transport system permease protein